MKEIQTEPLSTSSEEFRQKAIDLLSQHGELMIKERQAYKAGGGGYWHLIREQEELLALLDNATSRTAFSIMLGRELQFRGVADDDLQESALTLLEQEGEILLFAIGLSDPYLSNIYANNEARVHQFFIKHQGKKLAIGRCPPWFDESEAMTGYVPDPDGTVRPGAY